MISLKSSKNYIRLIIFIFLVLFPFSISDYTDNVVPEKISSDLRFYEINTCSISLFEFLLHNPNVIYQDHYKIRFNNYSSIRCFGQITGIDQLGYDFYISIGTNSLINLFLQTGIWLFLISLIPINENFQKIKFVDYLALTITSLIIVGLIYSEKRYYDNAFFELEMISKRSYLYLFIYFFSISYVALNALNNRTEKVVNYIPYLFIFIGVFSGLNLYFLSIIFCVLGIKKVIKSKEIRRKFNFLNFIVFIWAYNALGMFYYLKPDKIRGLSHADYNFLSVMLWSYFIIFSLLGIYFFLKERKVNLNIEKFNFNLLNTGVLILILGYLGSSMPFFNFMNYYYFGQTKYGTTNQNLFSVDSWGVTEAWRGFFPSAETIGEFFALAILLIFLYKTTKYKYFVYFGVLTLLFGLLASNNKAAIFSLLLCIVLKVNHENQISAFTKIILFIPVVLVLLYFIRFENLFYSIEFSSFKFIDMAKNYSLESNISSSIMYLSNIESKNLITRTFILLFGFIAFLINRSELWGIFFARYNPSVSELFFGTGPFVLSNHYGEIDIFNKRVFTGSELGFLLPHSSLLLIFVFTGLMGVVIILYHLFKVIYKKRVTNYNEFLVSIFIFINLIKSDSILYLPAIVIYLLFLLTAKKRGDFESLL